MQKQRLQSLTLLMLAPFFCTGQATAAGTEMDLFALNLEQLLAVEVSTLNKRPQSYFQLPAASYILTRKEIERSGALTIPDLLVRVPGVFIKQLSSDFTAVSVRNDVQVFNTSLLVLIDGNPFYLPATSNAFWSALPVAVEEIEQIEVIRGDGGTAWGTNSSSGVVNIITRTAATDPGKRVSGVMGNNGLLRTHGTVSNEGLKLSAHLERDSGWSDDPSSYRSGYLSAHYEKDLSEWHTVLSGRLLKKRTSDVESLYTGAFEDAGSHSYSATLSVSRDFGDDMLFLKAFVYDFETDVAVNSTQDVRQKTYDMEARYLLSHALWHQTQFGINYRRYVSEMAPQQFVNQSDERLSDSLVSLTIDHESRISQQTMLNLGLRHERFSLLAGDDGLWSYSLRLSHQLSEQTVVWGSANQSWQLPSYQQTDFEAFAGAAGSSLFYQTGNPDLQPERNRNLEIGLRNRIAEGVTVDLSAFYGQVRDEAFVDPLAITIEPAGPFTRFNQTYTNHIESRLWGAELLLGWDVTPSLHTDLGLTWFHKESEVQDGRYRGEINEQYAPEYKVTLNSRYRFSEKTDLALFLLYEAGHSTQAATLYTPTGQTDDHFRLDGSLNHHFSSQGSLSLGFKNLFNSAVEWDFPFAVAQPVEVEPSVWLKLGYRFD